jgi:hypothetical protein
MQSDLDDVPPEDEPLAGLDSDLAASDGTEMPIADETAAIDETAGIDHAAGMAVIRAIEDSLARPEGDSSAPTAATTVAPLPLSIDAATAVNESYEAEALEESNVPLTAEAEFPLTAGDNANAVLGPPPQVKWSPFMQLVTGNAPPVSNSTDEGYVERPWTSVNPPKTEAAIAQLPFVRPETAAGAGPVISVFVQVHLTDDAIRRVAETTVREEAAKSQHQIEVVAKRLFDLENNLFRQAAERRRLWG